MENFKFRFYLDPNPPETFRLLVRPMIRLVEDAATKYGKDVSVSLSASQMTYEYFVNIEYDGARIRGEAEAFVKAVLSKMNRADLKYIRRL